MAVSAYIKSNNLRVLPSLLEETIKFYTQICGMTYERENRGGYERHVFSFSKTSDYTPTAVSFQCDSDFTTSPPNAGYWKVGFALQDVDSAVASFRNNDIRVRKANQFVDIGYLTSLSDPNGYSIELLQHSFEKNFCVIPGERLLRQLNQPSSFPPVLGQITLRCKDATRSCEFYANTLGMRLLSIQTPGKKFPFTLYFFAYTDEVPPNSQDLTAIENREWLWKKPFCQIELQHVHGSETNAGHYFTNDKNSREKIGHMGFSVVVSMELFSKIKDLGDRIDTNTFLLEDPDGYRIEVSC